MSIIVNRVLAGERPVAGKAPPSTNSLDDLTVGELRTICADEGIDVPKRARKADIITAIEAHRGY